MATHPRNHRINHKDSSRVPFCWFQGHQQLTGTISTGRSTFVGLIFILKMFRKRTIEEKKETAWSKEQYRSEADRIFELSWDVMHKAEWQIQKQSAIGDAYAAKLPGMNKLFKIKGIVDLSPRDLLDLLFANPENYAKWNPVIEESLLLEHIDEQTHVSYQVTAERLGGLVARRDFVMLTRWAERAGALVLAMASVPHHTAPSADRHIRGETRSGCYIIRPVPEEPEKSGVEWYLDTNLKGWLPLKVLDAAFASIMTDNLKNLQNAAKDHHANICK